MSDNKQQTAVDLAFEKLANQGLLVTKDYKNLVAYREAKEIEKERMIEFGELCWKNLLRSDVIMRPRDVYNETYGGNK